MGRDPLKMYSQANRPQSEMTASPDKYPQKKFREKQCRKCGDMFSPEAPSHLYCSQKCADIGLQDAYLKRTYGIDSALYYDLLEEQNHECKICGSEGFTMAKHHKVKLVVDHCHQTGKVRGLLCHNCNRALGLLQDNISFLDKAKEYLRRAR